MVLYEQKEDGKEEFKAWGNTVAFLFDESVKANDCKKFVKRDWFKVFLDNNCYIKDNRHFEQFSLSDIKRWTADFLRPIYEDIENHVRSRLHDPNMWANGHIIFSFAVPDMWFLEHTSALEHFVDCVRKAKFGSGGTQHEIRVATEALSALHCFPLAEFNRSGVPHQNILVLDAGGASVDIALCQVSNAHGNLTITSKKIDCKHLCPRWCQF